MNSTSMLVFEQMWVIIFLITIGYFSYKKGFVTDKGAKTISFLVVNVTNPAVAISSAFSDDIEISHADILIGLALCAFIYVIILALGHLLPVFICKDRSKRKFYTMLCVYSNIGFMGIPVVSAVLGNQALIYVTIFIIIFNLIFYTHGYIVMLSDEEGVEFKISPKTFINVGTLSGIAAILVFWFRLRFPPVIEDTLSYCGRSTTFLAMIILGVALAKIPLKSMFNDVRLWVLWAIRYFAFPIAVAFIIKSLMGTSLMSGSFILLLAMPAGNIPVILAQQYDIDTSTLSPEMFISTMLSLITVTLVAGMI